MAAIKEFSVSSCKIAQILNSTTLKILQAIRVEPLSVTAISNKVGLTEGHVSEAVRALEDLNLVDITYERGKRGIRKISSSTIDKITINLKN